MIELSTNTAVLLYLSTTLCAMFVFWIMQHFYTKRKMELAPLHKVCQCEYCHFVYIDTEQKTLTRCPQCSSLNQANDR